MTESTLPQCEIRFKICQGNAIVSWLCEVEGTPIISCKACRAEWMRMAALYPDLKPRCPNCSKGRLRNMDVRRKEVSPLTGLIARDLDEAMRVEGVLINVRQAVLKRLARDASWLNEWGTAAEESAPGEAGQGGDGSAASAGRAGGEVGVLGSAQTVGVS